MRVENWLPVPGFEGFYEVSDLGRVRSMARTVCTGRSYGKRELPARILKPKLKANGYREVTLQRDGEIKHRMVHRLVLEAFAGPCPPGREGCHGPNGQADNSLANLSWGTREKNCGDDKRRDGTMQHGERNGLAKLTADDVREIRRLHATGSYSQRELARKFQVSHPNIGAIVRRETWTHVV